MSIKIVIYSCDNLMLSENISEISRDRLLFCFSKHLVVKKAKTKVCFDEFMLFISNIDLMVVWRCHLIKFRQVNPKYPEVSELHPLRFFSK